MRGHREPVAGSAEQLDQLVAHDLDHLLAGGERLQHVLPDRFDADPLDEGLHDLEVDVGFQQGHPHFAQGLLDVLLRQPAKATEPVEDSGQTTGQAVEHRLTTRGMCLETLKDTDEAGKSQALFTTSEALLSWVTAAPGSAVPKTDDPATSTVAPAWASAPALVALAPPSTETRTSRVPRMARSRRILP